MTAAGPDELELGYCSKDSDEFCRGLIENIGEGVLCIDGDRKILFSNTAARELLELGAPGAPASEVLRRLSCHSDSKQRQLRSKLPDGREVIIGYCCNECSFGDAGGMVVTLRDITETENLRADLEKMKRLSEIGRMCAVVAHEIRNPLAGITATIQSIELEVNDAGLAQPIEAIQEDVERLGHLLSDFSAFARYRSPQRRLTDIAERIADVKRAAQPYLEGLEWRTEIGELPQVWMDPDQLKQVLLNVVINAAQAVGDAGIVTVRARAETHDLVIQVEDTGSGITPAERRKIFDAFYTTKAGGTGLGLSVCFRIVNDHGGSIAVESEPGQGTSVEIRLPMLQPG